MLLMKIYAKHYRHTIHQKLHHLQLFQLLRTIALNIRNIHNYPDSFLSHLLSILLKLQPNDTHAPRCSVLMVCQHVTLLNIFICPYFIQVSCWHLLGFNAHLFLPKLFLKTELMLGASAEMEKVISKQTNMDWTQYKLQLEINHKPTMIRI